MVVSEDATVILLLPIYHFFRDFYPWMTSNLKTWKIARKTLEKIQEKLDKKQIGNNTIQM